MMAASVSTLVVSWNDDAEMNDSVDSDALVMPSSSGSAIAGWPPRAITFSFSRSNMCFSTCSSTRKLVSPTSLDAHAAQHLAHDRLDVLVVDLHALQSVDLLDFVDQVLGQRLLAQHPQDVVRVGRAVHQRLAGADAVAFAARSGACPWGSGTRCGSPTSGVMITLRLPLVSLPKCTDAVDLGDDGVVLRLAGLEQLGDARQTAGDVLGLRGLARDLGDDRRRPRRCSPSVTEMFEPTGRK